eukprot:symbB.v1.2.032433.t1/scaffold3896.1/size48723/2
MKTVVEVTDDHAQICVIGIVITDLIGTDDVRVGIGMTVTGDQTTDPGRMAPSGAVTAASQDQRTSQEQCDRELR